jgi:aquaporin Z
LSQRPEIPQEPRRAEALDPRPFIAEALGTLVLVALGPGAAIVAAKTHAFGQAGIALTFGLAVTIVVAATAHLSGAHINPAVTLGLWSVGRFPVGRVIPYLAAQCTGSITASALLLWILGREGGYGATIPALPIPQAFAVEAGYSGILGFVIMAVADSRIPLGIAPFTIGGTVFAGALVTGPLTGGSFNPARSLGPAVIGGVWDAHWLYWAAPIAGMLVAMRLFDALRPRSPPRR